MANFHTIKAQLYDNALTENPNDFVARVASERSLFIADICQSEVFPAPVVNTSLWV